MPAEPPQLSDHARRAMNPFGSATGCTLDGQPQNTILKSGPRVREAEVEALKLAKTLDLPVPAIHEVRELPEGGIAISMDLVQGEPLEAVWDGMTAEEKTSVARQLGEMITLLRSATQSEHRIGAIGGEARDSRRFGKHTGGPFTTEADFNNFLLDVYKVTPVAIQRALRNSLRTNHRIVFTHADLSPRNIIVSNGRIAGLLDWEVAGWYPEYWEYVKFFECVTNCKDWKNFANLIFDTEYLPELVTHQALVRWQKP